MLLKLLSQKSILFQFLWGLLFLGLIYLNLNSLEPNWQSFTAVLLLIFSVLICLLFYIHSNLFRNIGVALWFLLIWTVVFSGICSDWKICFSLFFCTLMVRSWLSGEDKKSSKRFLFDSGALLMLSAIFYPPSLFLAGFLFVTYPYVQNISLKGILMLILGMLVPLIIGIQILFVSDQTEIINSYSTAFYLNFWQSTSLILIPVGLIILVSWTNHLLNFSTQDINKRQKYFLTFIYFINWIIILALFGGEQQNLLIFLGLPVSIFLSRFVQYLNSDKYKEIWLWLYATVMAAFFFRIQIYEIFDNLLGNVSFGF